MPPKTAKRLGQHFITDRKLLAEIARLAGVKPTDGVLEIGAGTGSLTEALAERAAKVVAVEIDPGLVEALRLRFRSSSRVEVVKSDILKADLEAIAAGPLRHLAVRAVGNIPYYITAPIIARLIEHRRLFCDFTLLMQREVADRVCARPGSKGCGAISALVWYHTIPEHLLLVPRTAFRPPPGVDSVLVRFAIRKKPAVRCDDEGVLFRVIRATFQMRRKTAVNALAHDVSIEMSKDQLVTLLQEIGLDSRIRGEAITLEEFARIAKAVGRKP
jgi:16S rRNA (adenine1518-N6/adenine1519-N6)-dimethyltransferase